MNKQVRSLLTVGDTIFHTSKGVLCTSVVYVLKNKEVGVYAEKRGKKQFSNVPFSKVVAVHKSTGLEIINQQLYDKFSQTTEFPIP
jgi:sporulation protein YlmC with PRC-barrel domain